MVFGPSVASKEDLSLILCRGTRSIAAPPSCPPRQASSNRPSRPGHAGMIQAMLGFSCTPLKQTPQEHKLSCKHPPCRSATASGPHPDRKTLPLFVVAGPSLRCFVSAVQHFHLSDDHGTSCAAPRMPSRLSEACSQHWAPIFSRSPFLSFHPPLAQLGQGGILAKRVRPGSQQPTPQFQNVWSYHSPLQMFSFGPPWRCRREMCWEPLESTVPALSDCPSDSTSGHGPRTRVVIDPRVWPQLD
mmetsp:Transcript_40497/g.82757  ORF Transcript_40497/g.82757 Transcript_40497/m.82757 type:complete len:244 (+) Transcript_40497:1092-1823(+)